MLRAMLLSAFCLLCLTMGVFGSQTMSSSPVVIDYFGNWMNGFSTRVAEYFVGTTATAITVYCAVVNDQIDSYVAAAVAVAALISKPLLEIYNAYRVRRRNQDSEDRKRFINDLIKCEKILIRLERRINTGEERIKAAEERSREIVDMVERITQRLPFVDESSQSPEGWSE